MKITRFQDIPKFTDVGHYAVDYPFHSLVAYLEREVEESGLQLNPEFQRGHVWTKKQQVAYMEFLAPRRPHRPGFIFQQPQLAP